MKKYLVAVSVLLILFGGTVCAHSAEFTMIEEGSALVNGTLIDGTGRAPLPDAVVLIEGDRITAVGTRSTVDVPKRFRIVDARGGTILPGIINAHVHALCREGAYLSWAEAGVTTVRDLMACPFDKDFAIRDRVNRNPLNARVVMAGPQMTSIGGFAPAPEYNIYVRSNEDAIVQAERIIKEGADQLKILLDSTEELPLLSPEIVRAIVETGHKRGKRISAHVSLSRDAELALTAGCDDLAHMVVDELPVGLAKRMADSGILWIPTIEVRMATARGRNVIKNLRKFVEAGGRVALGTDYSEYFAEFEMGIPLKEMEWMREAGMTPMQIIVASTGNAAEACGLRDKTGTVEAGKLADLIIVGDDPLKDLKTLKHVRIVMHSGIIVRQD
ncbi:MAG: hypothetical protein EG826_10130 [Deltaproteobacteria bacterium]|nr:hypothetical protein [Deltaproteobacteria bacterium]